VTTRDSRVDWTAFLRTDVHIWRVRLDLRGSAFDRLDSVLSEHERDRARRFRFEHLQQQFTIAHGAVRVLLGRYLSAAPDRLRFGEGSHGKPELSEPSTAIRFNLSHSNDLAVLAVAGDRDVGVDIEAMRPVPEMDEIAERYFSHQEAIDLMQTAGDARERNFFRIWTRKEAFIKAIGEGLSCPLDSFAVSFASDDAARLLHLRGDAAAGRSWQLHAFEPAPGFAGAVAYRGERLGLKLFPSLDCDELMTASTAGSVLPPAQENR
jgi:4'-phosphopantetheinyl transferase